MFLKLLNEEPTFLGLNLILVGSASSGLISFNTIKIISLKAAQGHQEGGLHRKTW